MTDQNQLLREALTLAKDAIEAVMDEMAVGDRFTNAGQSLLDVIGPIRAALAQPAEGGEVVCQIARKDATHAWIDVDAQGFEDAGLYPAEFKRRKLYTTPKPSTLTAHFPLDQEPSA